MIHIEEWQPGKRPFWSSIKNINITKFLVLINDIHMLGTTIADFPIFETRQDRRLCKNPEFDFPVIPAEAGIQYFQQVLDAGVRRQDASATFKEASCFGAVSYVQMFRCETG
jgi:hypothetical protein